MSFEDLTSMLWRRKLIFVLTLLLCLGAVVAASLLLPKSYRATSTLFVAGPKTDVETALDTTQGEQLARTYTALASTPSVADAVLEELPLDLTREELLSRMSFAPIERTQLLNITAEADTPDEAAGIANNYADVFVVRSDQLADDKRAPSKVAVSERAVPPEEPSSPNLPLLIGLGSLLSILAAFGASLLRDRLDQRLKIADDDGTIEGVSIIGRTPMMDDYSSLAEVGQSAQMTDALRILRTNLELTGGKPTKTVLITSSSEGEGKSTIAAGLAVALARDGDAVTLIECDLRRPTLDLAGLGDEFATAGPGLVSFLTGSSGANGILRHGPSEPNLNVIYSGSVGLDPGPLLRSPNLGVLMAARRLAGDWVIIDTPPVSVGDDALLLTPQVDGVIIVKDAHHASLPAFRAAIGQLERVGARVHGVVLNRAVVKSSSYYYTPPDASNKKSANLDGEAAEPPKSAAPSA
ncbi:MAG: polysaccharide biosynthesis tyrosine autokinase [Solirubrobacterales bacterium]|nr:polysaccharide biosynthesis tyrosine autokinase [Solirubrobacterales bacterium]